MDRLRRRFVREEAGQELVEFALASIVFLMTIFGTLQFGLVVWRYNMVSNLAQEGARWASVRGTTSSLGTANQSAVEGFVRGRWPGIDPTVTLSGSGVPGSTLTVTVTTDFAPLTQLIPVGTLTLSSTASMVVSR